MSLSMFLMCLCLCCLDYGEAVTMKQAALDGHNDARRKEAKAETASNIYELVWDDALEKGARAWAEKCDFGHQHIHNQGENIYYHSPSSHSDDYYVHRAINDWMTEKSFNKHGNFDCCYHGHYTCCHYTQVVAARTTRLGCAVAHCDTLTRENRTISHHAAFVVCDYEPAGNVAVNGHHAAYATGDLCGQCHSGDTCDDGLCVKSA